MKSREAEKRVSSFMMAPLSFHESCHPSQLINFSASPWTSWLIFDKFTLHHRDLCHWDCSSRSKLLEGSFLPFFHLDREQAGRQSLTWTPVSYLQNNMSHLGAVKCFCHCFNLVTVKYLLLCLFNLLISNCTTKALKRTETFFDTGCHKEIENSAEFCRDVPSVPCNI